MPFTAAAALPAARSDAKPAVQGAPPSPEPRPNHSEDHIAVDLCTIRALPNLLDDDDVEDLDLQFLSALSLKEVLLLLKSPNEVEREEAIATLAEIVDNAFGEDGVRLGEEVRGCGAIALIAKLLSDPDELIQQTSLGIIGNLCSDAVDANSKATKSSLLPHALALFSCAYTEEPCTLCVACGALQNLTAEKAWTRLAVSHDVHLRLEQLVVAHSGVQELESQHIVRYASGALRNITSWGSLNQQISPATLTAITQRAREHRIESLETQRAKAIVERAVLGIPAERRRNRQELGLLRKRQAQQSDTASEASVTTYSYETISRSARSSRATSSSTSRAPSRDVSLSRPASRCSHDAVVPA